MTETDQIIELDFGCVPEAAVSGACLVQSERSTFLTFNAMRQMADGYHYEQAGIALVEFSFCLRTQFGHPNDEARPGHPLYSKGLNLYAYGIFEVVHSTWVSQIRQENLIAFPNVPHWGQVLRHFIFTFHDTTFECVAADLKLEIVNERYKRVFSRISKRILSE